MNFNTQLLHGKSVGAYSFGATLPSISQVSAYTYETSEQLEKVCQNRAAGFAYTRIGNPTVAAFERRICEMEGGFSATACASGLSAVVFSLLNILQSGDEIIVSSGVFGGTIDVFRDLQNFGIQVHYIPYLSEENITPLLNEKTRAVFGEVISNPGLDVIDVSAVAAFVHTHQVPLILDSTTAGSSGSAGTGSSTAAWWLRWCDLKPAGWQQGTSLPPDESSEICAHCNKYRRSADAGHSSGFHDLHSQY